jgi:transcription elongation factor GreA
VGDNLTAEQHTRLAAELAELEGPRREEIIQAIKVARGHGDLSENFEYHAAKNEQGLLERRITILRARLHEAVVIDEASVATSKVVTIGSVVELEDEHGEHMQVEISSAGGSGSVSPDSPLGAALLGAAEGKTVKVKAPRGSWRARVVSIRRS